MTLHGLLGDVLAQLRPAEETAPGSPQTPAWITERITSVAGMLVLNRADLADQVQLVLQIAGALCREGRTSARTLAQRHGWPPPLIQRTRRALSLIAGLEQLGRSWAPDPVGTTATIPVWNGRQRWLLATSLELHSTRGKAAINRCKSSRPLVMKVARHDADNADGSTGRGVRTSHETVARQLGVSRDAVRHARYVLEAIGMSVTVVQGRYLTADERAAAHAHHGGRQRRIASTRHLTMPRGIARTVARHLPRSGSVRPTALESSNSPRRAGTSKRRPKLPQIPLAWQKLAAQVVTVLPHLGQRHLGNLARGLMRLPIDPTTWTGPRLVRLIELNNREKGMTQPESVRSTLGLFLHQVHAGLAGVAHHTTRA